LQTFYYPKIMSRMLELPDWADKLSVSFKGPGWTPGKPRLGDNNDVPEIPHREKFDPKIPTWQNYYTAFHFLIVLVGFNYLSQQNMELSQTVVTLSVGFILFSLTSIALILENRSSGIYMEILRNTIALFVVIKSETSKSLFGGIILILVLSSIIVWVYHLTQIYSSPKLNKPKSK